MKASLVGEAKKGVFVIPVAELGAAMKASLVGEAKIASAAGVAPLITRAAMKASLVGEAKRTAELVIFNVPTAPQ